MSGDINLDTHITDVVNTILFNDLDDVVLLPHIHDLAAEDVHDAQNFGAVLRTGLDTDQGHFAFDRVGVGQVAYLDHVDEFVELLFDLLHHRRIGLGDDGDPGDTGCHGFGHAEAFDIEAPTAEEADDTRENAGLVVHQHGDDVFVFLHIRS